MIEKKDFVKIKYSGKVKETGEEFDSAEEKTIPLTAGYILEGFEEKLLDKEVGDSFKITLKPKEAFGKRDSDKLKVMPKSKFEGIERPLRKGARLNINGELATVKAITGGRVMVDFNHPLAGKVVTYEGKILREVKNNKDKVKSILKVYRLEENEIDIGEETVNIKVKRELPDWLKEKVQEDIEEYIGLKTEFEEIEEENEKD